jgi:hypothetical protein
MRPHQLTLILSFSSRTRGWGKEKGLVFQEFLSRPFFEQKGAGCQGMDAALAAGAAHDQ